MVKFVKFLLALSWMAFIFITSEISFPDADPAKQKTMYDYIFDKDVHIILFGGLSFFITSFLSRYKMKFYAVFYLSILFTFFYGLSDEYHQMFVAGREASVYDLLFDVIGAVMGVIMYRVWAGMAREKKL